MTQTTTKSPTLTIERANQIVAGLMGHNIWEVHRVVGQEIEGVARATRKTNGEERLFVINNGRIVSFC